MKEQSTNQYLCVAPDVQLGKDVKLANFINLYGCKIGNETKIGTFVEIQKKAKVGLRCKISSHTLISEGVTIEDHVFIGHGVTFIKDKQAVDDMNGRGDTPWQVWRPREGRVRNA